VDGGSGFGDFWIHVSEFDYPSHLSADDWADYLPIFAAQEKGGGIGAQIEGKT
jgi:hypothetical protein